MTEPSIASSGFESSRPSRDPAQHHGPHGKVLALTVGALGVVYGDIGTSPLYAANEIFFGHGGAAVTRDNVLGCFSLVLWCLTLVVAIKYLVLVVRADNDGEGGVFALYGLLHRYKATGMGALLWVLMLAAGLLFGDGIITPAISVLSAVEGLKLATPVLEPYIVTITIAILTGLFAIQFKGTAKVGSVFGPIVVVWFVAIALLGGNQIARHPEILAALDPRHAVRFLGGAGLHGSLLVLGSVMLTVTGGEALYADMGHFGKRPIRISWFAMVYPALLMSYLGQGAFLLGGEKVLGNNLFYSLVPPIALVPMVLLATAATIIASQALISGAFSLAAQAVALGLLPRLRIVHTHRDHEGQIYSPFINWTIYLGCVLLVISFRSSSALASAYGLAVSGVMLATSLAMLAIARLSWGWSPLRSTLTFGLLGAIDASFLLANSLKFLEGGFIPLTLGLVLFSMMVTWRWGRKATFAAYSGHKTMTMKELCALKRSSATFFDRNMLFMVPKPLRSADDNTPALLQLFWDRYGMLPRNLVFVEVVHRKVPYVHDERYHVTVFDRDPGRGSILSVTVKFGFMEDPNVERVLEELAGHHQIDLPPDPHLWVVQVSQERLLPAKGTSVLGHVRFKLFALLRQISPPAYYHYGLGNDLRLSMEIMSVKIK